MFHAVYADFFYRKVMPMRWIFDKAEFARTASFVANAAR